MRQHAKTEALLLQYAAGSLNAAESFMVAALIAVNDTARQQVHSFEKMGGRFIQEEPPASISTGCLNSVLQRIEEATEALDHQSQCCEDAKTDEMIPDILRPLFSDHCTGDLCWVTLSRGVKKLDLKIEPCHTPNKQLRLMHLAPNQATPAHRHNGAEMTLILEGGFSDISGEYSKGDIVIIDDHNYLHSPKAGVNGCLCLTLTEAPLRFEAPFNRLLNLFLRF